MRDVRRMRMHAEHPITAASRRRQAQPCVACSPCTCSSLGGGRRWSFPRSPHRCSSPGCARRWRRPRSPCRRSSVGSARVLDLKQLGSVELERVLGFLDLQAQRRNELQTLLVLSSCSFLNLEAIKLRLQVGTASLPPPWPRCPLRWRQPCCPSEPDPAASSVDPPPGTPRLITALLLSPSSVAKGEHDRRDGTGRRRPRRGRGVFGRTRVSSGDVGTALPAARRWPVEKRRKKSTNSNFGFHMKIPIGIFMLEA